MMLLNIFSEVLIWLYSLSSLEFWLIIFCLYQWIAGAAVRVLQFKRSEQLVEMNDLQEESILILKSTVFIQQAIIDKQTQISSPMKKKYIICMVTNQINPATVRQSSVCQESDSPKSQLVMTEIDTTEDFNQAVTIMKNEKQKSPTKRIVLLTEYELF